MSNPNPQYDPENVRTDDHPRAPRDMSYKKALAKKMRSEPKRKKESVEEYAKKIRSKGYKFGKMPGGWYERDEK